MKICFTDNKKTLRRGKVFGIIAVVVCVTFERWEQ
jgi:hypothetical protein